MKATASNQAAKDARLKKQAQAAVDYWQKRGIASEWQIILEVEPFFSENVQANIDWQPDYRNAVLHINSQSSYASKGGAHLKRVLLHELLHLVLAPMNDAVAKAFRLESAFNGEFMDRQETVTDTLTTWIWANAGIRI